MDPPKLLVDDVSRDELLVLRDHLALDRTRLANERTFLSYIRTAFMFAVTGVTALKLFQPTSLLVATAWLFIAIGALVVVFGVWRFVTVRQEINQRTSHNRRLAN
jgi:putative membrane protein